MLEIRKLEELDESFFEEEFNIWLSDKPLRNDEICNLMHEVERQRKHEGKPRPHHRERRAQREDARQAVDEGAAAIVVSNHGGRTGLRFANAARPAEVVHAVKGRTGSFDG